MSKRNSRKNRNNRNRKRKHPGESSGTGHQNSPAHSSTLAESHGSKRSKVSRIDHADGKKWIESVRKKLGEKCMAPYTSDQTMEKYHRARIVAVPALSEETDFDALKVSVEFLHPFELQQLVCNEYQDNKCVTPNCPHSHRKFEVLFKAILDYEEPKKEEIKPGSRVLAKYGNNLWYPATTQQITEDDKWQVKFYTGYEYQVAREDIFPVPKIPIEILLSSPFSWKPSKTCNFWVECHDLVKNASINHLEESHKQIIISIRKSIAKKSWIFWCSQESWENVLGDFYKQVMKGENFAKPDWQYNPIRLLQVIRDAHAHHTQKNVAAWFREMTIAGKGGLPCFVESQFVQFWVEHFPMLTPFLWKEFSCFEKSFEEESIYPTWETQPHTSLYFGLQEWVWNMWEACRDNLNKGLTKSRYKCNGSNPSLTIEFSTLPSQIITPVLDSSDLAIFEIFEEQLQVTWYGETGTGNSLVHRVEKDINGERQIQWSSDKMGMFIVASSVASISKYKHVFTQTGSKKIVIFTSKEISEREENMKKCAEEISLAQGENTELVKVPVTWNELDDQVKEKVLDEGEVNFNGKIVKLETLLPKATIPRNILLFYLTDTLLNELLQGNKPEILSLPKAQSTSTVYLPRFLKIVQVVDNSFFGRNPSDIFVVAGIEKEQLNKILGTKNQTKEINIENFPWNTVDLGFLTQKILVAKTDFRDDDFHLADCVATRNVHFLRYLNNTVFERVKTVGSAANRREELNNGWWNDDDEGHFEKFLNDNDKCFKLIFGETGTGKSELLRNLSMNISNAPKHFAFIYSLNDFLKDLDRNCLNISSIISRLASLSKLNTFEQKLVETWLRVSATTQVHILLDALDEVPLIDRGLAFKVLWFVQKKLPFVRLWVTAKDHMLGQTYQKHISKNSEERISFQFLNIMPFTKENQKEFFKNYWDPNNNHTEPQNLDQFIDLCIKSLETIEAKSIVGVPLLCKMIAETLHDKVKKNEFNFPDGVKFTLCGLYEDMIQKIFERFLKEKLEFTENTFKREKTDRMRQMILSHTFFAIKRIFRDKTPNCFKNLLGTGCHNEIAGQGLLKNKDLLEFLHNTFAEFLIAHFVCKVWKGEYKDIIESKNGAFQKFFWENVLSSSMAKPWYGDFDNPTICMFVDAMMKQQHSHDADILHKVEKATNLWIKDKTTVFEGETYTFPIPNGYPSLKWFFIQSHEIWLRKLLLNCIQFMSVDVENRKCLIKYLIENYGQLKKLALIQREMGAESGVLHMLLFDASIDRNRALDAEFIKWIVGQDSSVVEQEDDYGNTPLLRMVKTCLHYENHRGLAAKVWVVIKLLVEELGANIYAIDKERRGVLHHGGWKDGIDSKNLCKYFKEHDTEGWLPVSAM